MMPSLGKGREEVSSKVFSSPTQYAKFRLDNQNIHESTVTLFKEATCRRLADVIHFQRALFKPQQPALGPNDRYNSHETDPGQQGHDQLQRNSISRPCSERHTGCQCYGQANDQHGQKPISIDAFVGLSPAQDVPYSNNRTQNERSPDAAKRDGITPEIQSCRSQNAGLWMDESL
jgi:hypothetical protein